MFRKKLSLVVIVIACWSVASAQTPRSTAPARPVNANDSTTGVISGSVVNEGGQPLAGVAVTVWNHVRNETHRSTTTDADGKFQVRGLMPSLYSVSAFLPAYVRQAEETYAPSTYHRLGDTVTITMIPGGVITGKVTNAEGEPVIGVRVRSVMVRNALGDALRVGAVAVVAEASTDDRGVYRIFGIAPGVYLVSAAGASFPEPYRLDPYDSDVPTYAPSSTRDTASEIVVRTGEETTVDIRYRGEPGHVVSGTVKVPVAAGGGVSLTPVGGTSPIAHAFQSPGGRGFSFKGVADGEYEIVANEIPQQSGPNSDIATSEPRRITVKGADVTGLELVPRPPASLGGRIVLEPAKVTACENKRRPLYAEMLVLPQRPERDDQDRVPFLRMLSSPAQPDANGNFVLRNLTPGKYLLEPRFFGRYWYLHSISVGGTAKIDAAANWTNVKYGDQLTNFTITLAEGAASIRGKVTTANAAEANAAELPTNLAVYLVPAEREKFTDVLRYFVGSVETNGEFALNNLPPGRYHVLVQSLDATTSTLSKLRLPEAAEARAKLRRAAETRKTDLELKPCQNLTDHTVIFKP